MRRIERMIIIFVLVCGPAVLFAEQQGGEQITNTPPAAADLGLSQRLGDIEVEQTADGYVLNIKTSQGVQAMRPEQFAARLHDQQSRRNWLFGVMNITTWMGVAWVGLGLLGQVLFTGRMIVQWVVSEKRKRSVVPVAFWWMSITGATMLLVYFVWRRDIVGVIGQGTGWFIYVRNLRLIYSSKYGGKDRDKNGPPPIGMEASD